MQSDKLPELVGDFKLRQIGSLPTSSGGLSDIGNKRLTAWLATH